MTKYLQNANQLDVNRSKVYINLYGLSGCGKTYSSLLIATGLSLSNDRVIILDTENRSDMLARVFPGVYKLNPPKSNLSTISEIIMEIKQSNKYDVVVIDSLTPLWDGEDGLLTNTDKDSISSMAKWKKPKQQVTAFTQLLRNCGLHVITTSLAKEEKNKNMEKTGAIIPIFERDKFQPYLDIQLLLENKSGQEGSIKDVVKSWCPELKNFLKTNVAIDNMFVNKIKEILSSASDNDQQQEDMCVKNIEIIRREERIDWFFEQTKDFNALEFRNWHNNLNNEDKLLYNEYSLPIKDRRDEYQLNKKNSLTSRSVNIDNLI